MREGRGSVSLLQRNLQIGYGRAARLIDFMAEDGIVGSYNGSQAREVLMTMADWEATKASGSDGTAVEPEIVEETISKIAAVPPVQQELFDEEEDEELEDELEEELEDEEAAEYEEEEDELEDEEDELEEDEEYEYVYEDEEAELDEDEEYEDEDVDEAAEYEDEEEDEADEELEDEYEYEYEDVDEGEAVEAVLEDEEAAKIAAKLEAFDGKEFEQENFDDKAFQKAVTDQTGLSAEEYEDVEDLAGEAKEAKSLAKIEPKKSKAGKRRRDPKQDNSERLSPHKSEKTSGKSKKKSRIVIHRPHK